MGAAKLIERYGLYPNDLADRVDLPIAALYRPDVLFDAKVANDFLEECAAACDDRYFGLKLGSMQSMSDVLAPLWGHIDRADTIGECLHRMANTLDQHTAAMSAFALEDQDGTSLCLEVRMEKGARNTRHSSRVQVVELSFAMLCSELKRRLGAHWRPQYAQFRHAKPVNTKPFRQIFTGDLRFNQEFSALRVCKTDCDRPAHIDQWRSGLPDFRPVSTQLEMPVPFVLQVDRVIRQGLNTGNISVAHVAEILQISPRTMQYKLKQHQSSYQQLLDIARIDLAMLYLHDSDTSILEISERLGFSDIATFSRFFKKHIKVSPRAYSRSARSL